MFCPHRGGVVSSDDTDTPAPSADSSTSISSTEEGEDDEDNDASDAGGNTNGAPPGIRPLLRLSAVLALGALSLSRVGGV